LYKWQAITLATDTLCDGRKRVLEHLRDARSETSGGLRNESDFDV